MNKKFLSAILFGALMVTSTGTFVSCKDYDDDIDNLQGQIDANKAGIEELKKLIGEGDYVTNVTKDGDNIVVSFKNAGDKTIELKDEVGSICKVENGELYIDGKATGIKISADAPVTEFKPAVKVEDGKWAVLQADGTYKTTGIPATGVTVSGSQTEGFILTFVNAEGEETVIELPTAASRITSLSVNKGEETTVKLNKYTFDITAEEKKAWEKATGKTVTSAKFIVADNAENKVSVRVNPVDVDATAIEFVAINGKNEVLPNVTFVANEDKNYATEVRAAYGNGLYHMTVKQFTLADDKASNALGEAMANDKGYYALTANKVYRAEYNKESQDGLPLFWHHPLPKGHSIRHSPPAQIHPHPARSAWSHRSHHIPVPSKGMLPQRNPHRLTYRLLLSLLPFFSPFHLSQIFSILPDVNIHFYTIYYLTIHRPIVQSFFPVR